MIGKIPSAISQSGDVIRFSFTDGTSCIFYHHQDCCEYVTIEDVNGDWNDLIGRPLLVADERVAREGDEPGLVAEDSHTWTFYTFRGIGGSVDVRWHGTSNGYYSESVDFRWDDAKEARDGR